MGGQLKDGDNLLYAEGYATAASISEAINQPVIMTVNAGNMVEVAGRLKDTFPNSTHYFLADNDIYKDENVGLEKATEAAELTAGHVLVPAFSNPKEGLTDYNDLHVSEGLEQVRLQVEGAINQMNRVDTMPTDNPNITDVNHSSTDSAAVADPEKAAPVASAPAAAEPEEAVPVSSTPAAAEPEYTAPTDRDGDDEESNSASDLEAYAAMMAFGGETTDSAQQKPERIAPSESVANTAPAENETEEKKKNKRRTGKRHTLGNQR